MAQPHLNFRDFTDRLRDDGDLVDINVEVNPHLEAAAITRKALESNNKAPLFNNVIGAKNGFFRMLGAPGGLRMDEATRFGRVALHLGLPVTSTPKQIIDYMASAKSRDPVPPRILNSGPCKENILLGDEIDFDQIPVPMLHQGDGGRYIQTYGMHVVKSPTTDWTSWSLQRAHVLNKNSLVGVCVPPEHIGKVFQEWKAIGKDMPWALAFGAPPAAIMSASMPLPDGVSEAEYIGAVTGDRIDLVKCETNDLYVPANSEIVLEGTVSITETADEGPFGEMHGYVFPADKVPGQPVFHVKCITHRNDAILPICPAGRSVDETHTLIGFGISAEFKRLCLSHGLPVKEVFTPFETNIVWAVVQIDTVQLRQMKTTSEKLSRQIGDLLLGSKPGWFIHKILVVGDDIDAFNFKDVMWAYSTRCRPGIDEYLYDNVPGFFLVPYMSHGPGDGFTGGKIICNCLLPVEYTTGPNWITCDFEHGYPEELKAKINENWTSIGY